MKWILRYFFRTIRLILGPILLLSEKVSTPAGIERPEEAQKQIDERTKHMALYQFKTCPFCIRVRKIIHKLNLKIEHLDAQHNMTYRNELLECGGKIKVPCLKISDPDGSIQWLYESDAIIQYLNDQFSPE